MSSVKNRKKLKNKRFSVRRRPFLRKINLENRGGCGIMDNVMLTRIWKETMSHKRKILIIYT